MLIKAVKIYCGQEIEDSEIYMVLFTVKYKEPDFFHPTQQAIYDSEARNVICISSNKAGKTLLSALLMNKNMLLMPSGSNGAWLAPFARTSKIGYELICKIIRSTPAYKYLEDSKSPKRFKFNSSQLQITYPNGNRIDFLQGLNVDAIFGQKYHFCIIDEATRLKNEIVSMGDETRVTCPAFDALKTTTRTTNARMVIISNPTTRSNFFYQWYLRAKEGKDSRTEAFHMDVYDSVKAGFVDIEEVKYAEEHESPFIFQRDWLGLVPDEHNSVFKADKVYECVDDDIKEDISKCYYFGIDLGFTDSNKSDWTVITGVDKAGRVRFFKRFKAEGDELINKLKAYINNRVSYIDATAGGGVMVYNLLKNDCPNLEPFKFSNTTKCETIENLAHYIHTKKISYNSNDILIDELLGYECEISDTGKSIYNNGKKTQHDDSVISLGLAVMKLREQNDVLDYSYRVQELSSMDEEEGWIEMNNDFSFNLNY